MGDGRNEGMGPQEIPTVKTITLGTIGLLIVLVGVAFALCGCASKDKWKPPGMLMQVEKKEVKS